MRIHLIVESDSGTEHSVTIENNQMKSRQDTLNMANIALSDILANAGWDYNA